MTDSLTTPTMAPPGGAAGASALTVGMSEPKAVADKAAGARAAEAGPAFGPPGAAAGVAAAGGVTATWRNGVNVTALWSINEVRNAFIFVPGIGWKKIYNGRDGAFTALVTLASQARQTGRTINFREEADGMVYEIYLW